MAEAIAESLGDLDRFLMSCDRAENDDALRTLFSTFRMSRPPSDIDDPLGPRYHEDQMGLYRYVSGREYRLQNEETPFDVGNAELNPFPYSTRSCATAGSHLVMIGELLRNLQIPAGGRVVEFGPGWGNLTLMLANLGFEVTAVDVESRFCELIRRRASRLGVTVSTVNRDFSWARDVMEPFDAVVFFECFHHSADHLSLLRDLHRVVKPGGRIYLGAEPILPDFPVPWGLRLDGQSLWSIRKFGWMELGFRDDYFTSALAATGWRGKRHTSETVIWELSRAGEEPLIWSADDARLGTQTGRQIDGRLLLEDADTGFGLYGPYEALPPGEYRARLVFSQGYPRKGRAELQVCHDTGRQVLARRPFTAEEAGDEEEIAFSLDKFCRDLEVRLRNERGFSAAIASVSITVDHEGSP